MNTNSLQTATQWKEKGINYLIDHGGAILSGIVIFIIGMFVASWSAKMVLRSLEKKQEKLRSCTLLLESVNYQRVLERGFAMVKDMKGKLVTSVKQAEQSETLSVVFADGEIKVRH